MTVAPTAGADPSPAIEVEGLVKRYGGRAVVSGVSFSVRRGWIVAILGPNGAGKTTTVEILEGYRRPDAGLVRVLGEEPAGAGHEHRARVGLMLQGGGGVDPRATPREVVRLHAALRRPSPDADALIDRVGLSGVAGTAVRRLSGGERQRLALAVALVGDPELLILDEPTAGMDPAAKRETRALLADLRASGRTITLTTHDVADVAQLADRVLILHNGRIVADGSPTELAASADPATTRETIRLSRPLTDEELAGLDVWLTGHGVERRASTAASGAALEARYLELTGDLDVEGNA